MNPDYAFGNLVFQLLRIKMGFSDSLKANIRECFRLNPRFLVKL
jgi:hypothetical protein